MTSLDAQTLQPARRRLTPNDARLRTLRVKTTRSVFLAGAALSTLLLIGSVIVRGVQGAAIDTSKLVQGDQFVMESPEFIGNTREGKRLKVTGARATRSVSDAAGAVRLEKPKLETADGSVATADEGIWSQDAQTLSLKGNVVFSRKAGERATGVSALWTSDPSVLTVEGGTQITLPGGETATAQSLQWDEAKGAVALLGNARVTFKDGEATSDQAYFDKESRTLTGTGSIRIRSELGTGAADRYVYNTASKRLQMTGNVIAQLR
ncbi:hypothetical protein [Aquidulcibacter paucihalophilus]|uniref:hypothetical protein n=1 Tax=Aquidulcibacter paucihalophilus TaxID=1978549 RepID=UPI000A18C6C5|nr:hypothetical protein [Aquidulcibacter paucihalophilus]